MCTNNLCVDRWKDEVIQWLLSEEGQSKKKAEMNKNFIIFFAIYPIALFFTDVRLLKNLRLRKSKMSVLCSVRGFK